MTSEELEKYTRKANVNRYLEQRAYFDGRHPAIYRERAKEAPDNRIPVPIVRKAVGQVMGYAFWPGSIQLSGEAVERIQPVYDANEETYLTAQLAETALIHGVAYELHWMQDGIARFEIVPIGQCIPIYNDEIRPKLVGFIRRWKDEDGRWFADTYDENITQKWEMNGRWNLVEEQAHGYKSVPVVEYRMAADKSNLFDHVLPLVDLLDQSMSQDVANELERFANSYLLMSDGIDSTTEDENGETELDKIKRTRAFTNLRENVQGRIAFLTKQIDPTFINTALDRMERLIYEMLSVPNPADNVFAAQTGIALEYKLQPFEYLVSTICAYFAKGLQQRIRLILNLDSTINGVVNDASKVQITFIRNRPDDIASIADNMVKLDAFLSRETLLKLLPSTIVPDIPRELALIGEAVRDFDTVEDDDAPGA
jgi:SPP1 family phage portal protein